MKPRGNAKRRHGNSYYAGKYAARIGGAIAGKALFGKPNLWGYKRGGVDTGVKKLLLLMSFGEESTYHTFSDGSTDIRSLWRQKEVLDPYWPQEFGSHRTLTPEDGTRS